MVRLEGDVLYNELHLTKDRKRSVGYVLQDDLLHEALTVYETLYYAAMLRLPKTMTKAQKLQRIQAVIDALGLDKCQNTIIGGFFRRGVSGGERKRVSVGFELLINPSVLLLDEPTSGLDSTTAMHLLQTLRQLAQGGRSICTTIHQPSSRLYQQLDSLLLLSQGHAMYYGQAADVVPWFEGLGYQQPMGVNTGDWILDLACGELGTARIGQTGEEARLSLVATAEKFLLDNPGGYSHNSTIKRYFSSKVSP
jgi:ABC-type multidrug transport system ATPase subunit